MEDRRSFDTFDDCDLILLPSPRRSVEWFVRETLTYHRSGQWAARAHSSKRLHQAEVANRGLGATQLWTREPPFNHMLDRPPRTRVPIKTHRTDISRRPHLFHVGPHNHGLSIVPRVSHPEMCAGFAGVVCMHRRRQSSPPGVTGVSQMQVKALPTASYDWLLGRRGSRPAQLTVDGRIVHVAPGGELHTSAIFQALGR